jgi:intraflagellar transport protein 88
MKNIGHSFVRLGQYQDAMQSYETVMEGAADVVTGYNLVVCFHALGDKEKMKKSFTRLLSTTPPDSADDDIELTTHEATDDGYARVDDRHMRALPKSDYLVSPPLDAPFRFFSSLVLDTVATPLH